MSAKLVRAFIATGALAIFCASWGCVADRPSRNGVYNENQYLRKAFIIRPADPNAPDPGWMLKGTIVAASSPNPLGRLNLGTGIESGGQYVRFNVTSDALQMLNMRELDQSQDITNQGTRTAEVVNSWAATNVDLKYRVNLDGEKTNYYEENQELDWQVRQWVKVNLDKNGPSDLAPFNGAQTVLNTCTDTGNITTTLVPGTFLVDEQNNYIQWQVQVTVPLRFDVDPSTGGPGPCSTAYGDTGLIFQRLGRQSVTLNVMYSLVRAVPDDKITYQPLVVGEKDPIRKKYGPIDFYGWSRDLSTGLVGARQLEIRFDPQKPIVWYLAQGWPSKYYYYFTCNAAPNTATPIVTPHGEPCNEATTMKGATNAILQQAGAPARVKFLNYNDDQVFGDAKGPSRQYGDVRYNFFRWTTDLSDDTGNTFLGDTQFVPDPRTGEAISSSVNIQNDALEDFVLTQLNYYLQTIGAYPATNPDGTWVDAPAGCQDGDTMPLDPNVLANNHNGFDTVYDKMQAYLHKPISQYGKLSPSDFIVKQDQDFLNAYYKLLPYEVYADPTTNAFTIPQGSENAYGPSAQMQALAGEAQFNKLMGDLDRGYEPYDYASGGPTGVSGALSYLSRLQSATIAHRDYQYKKMFSHPYAFYDTPDMVSFLNVFERDARHCVDYGNGKGPHWETKDEYEQNLLNSYWKLTIWHEFGHTLGMDHNFMASVDAPNWPHYTDKAGRDHIGTYQSSVMEYNSTPDRVFWSGVNGTGWAPYDQAAIAFLYANNQKQGDQGPYNPACLTGCSASGQATGGTAADMSFKGPPWKDPYGFQSDGKTEIQYLYCNAGHMKYTPLCRTFDFGATPSEIIANAIDTYEWGYKWRNFRLYRKFFDFSSYASQPAALITDMRKFMSQWTYDWSGTELQDNFRRLDVQVPNDSSGNPLYPVGTYYGQLADKFNAEMSIANQLVAAWHKAVIQQGSGERPFVTLYDPYFGDVTQQGIIDDKVLAMQSWTALWRTDNYDPYQAQGAYTTSYGSEFGDAAYQSVAEDSVTSMIGGQYDIFPFGKPLAVLQFAQATHDVNFIASAGRPEIRDWVGGKVFNGIREFMDYLHGLAAAANFTDPYTGTVCTNALDPAACPWDPTTKQVGTQDPYHSDINNQFLGPDGRRYIWAYIADRDQYVLVDRDRNIAMYIIMFNYTSDVIAAQNDGTLNEGGGGPVFYEQNQIKYFIDYFEYYNQQTQ